MGQFDVTGPDQKKYRVTVPEGATQDQAIDYVKRTYYGGASQPQHVENSFWGVFGDVAKGGGAGLLSGIEGVIGLPGDVERGVDWLSNKATEAVLGPPKRKMPDSVVSHAFPTSGQVGDVAEAGAKAIGGTTKYDPKTIYGEYAKTIGEFVPGAALPGGEASMLKRLTLYGVIPAMASETAGQVVGKNTPLGTAAQIAAGLAAGAGTAAFDRSGAIAARSADELERDAHTLYQQVDQSGFQINPRSLQNAMVNAGRDLYAQGLAPYIREVWSPFRTIYRTADGFARNNAPLTLIEVDRLRQLAKGPMSSADPNIVRLSGILRDHIDNWFAGLTPRDVRNMRNPQAAVTQLRQARLLWHQKRKHDIIAGIIHSAGLQASANYTMAGVSTALKQKFRALASNPRRMRVFAPDEQRAIEDIVRTGPGEGFIRLIGKMAIRTQLSMVGVAINTGTFGASGLVLHGIGEAAKRASEHITGQKAEDLSELIRGGTLPPGGRANPALYGGQATGAGGAMEEPGQP